MSARCLSRQPSRFAFQPRRREEPHASAGLHGRPADSDRQMRFAAPRLAVEHEVLGALYEFQRLQVLGAVSLREPHLGEVVTVERLRLRKGGFAEQPLLLAPGPHLLLHLDEPAGDLNLAGRGLLRKPLAGLVGEVH